MTDSANGDQSPFIGNNARTSHRRKRALTPLCFLVFSNCALAQQAVVEHCKQSSTEAERIACLEAALIGKEAQPEAAVAPSSATPEPASQVDPPSMQIDAGPADAETAEAAEVESSRVKAEPNGIGAEQVIARDQTGEERMEPLKAERGLVVVKYEWVPYERLVVTFENGQVWRQIKGDVNRIRTSLERNQTADITESALGGYQLHLNEIRRTIRVERVR